MGILKLTSRSVLAALGVAMLLSAAPANAKTYNLTLCGASPGGLWSLLGAGVDGAVKAAFPGSTVTYQTSGGGFANVALLGQKKCELGIVHDAEAILASKGEAPFKSPIKNLRMVSVLYTWAPMQVLVNKDFAEKHNLKSLADIAAKKIPARILVNRRGIVASPIAVDLLTEMGASPDNLKSWGGSITYSASKEQGELMRDRRADMIVNSLFVNHRSIQQLAKAIDLTILPLTGPAVDKVVKKWKIGKYTIPASAYAFADKDIKTITLSAQLYALDSADSTMIGDVSKALIDHADKVQGVHKAMKPFSAKIAGSGEAIAYHPAAEASFKKAGIR